MSKILVAAMICLAIGFVACSNGNSDITTPDERIVVASPVGEPLVIKETLPSGEQQNMPEAIVPPEESPSEIEGKEGNLTYIPTQQITISDEIIGIAIGVPAEGTIIDAEGYPHPLKGWTIWGGTVTIDEGHPGWSGCAPVIILNGNDYARTFHLSIQSPSKHHSDRWGDYKPLPEKYYSWITIEDNAPKVAIGGRKKVAVTLSIPYEFPKEFAGGKYWFGVLIEDWSQTGFIQLAQRMNWLVTFTE